MDIDKLINNELYIVTETFNREMIIPAFLILLKDNQRFVLPVAFKDDNHKEIVSQGMKDLVRNVIPDVVIFISEVWVSKLNLAAYKQGRMIKEANDRQEAIQVVFEFKTGEKFLKCAHIMRTGDIARLARFEDWDYSLMTGRFMNFF